MTAVQTTPYALPLLVSASLAALLAFLIWQRRPGAGVIPFCVLMLGVALWTYLNVGEVVFLDLQTKLVFAHFEYIGITIVPMCWLLFCLEYTGHEKWVTRRNVALLAIEPVLTVLAVWSNSSTHFIWASETLLTNNGLVLLNVPAATGFWLHAAYSYVLLLSGTLLLIQAMVRSPKQYRGQFVTLVLSATAPWIANFLYLTRLSPLGLLDLTPYSFTIMGALVAWSMIGYRLLDLAPIARNKVFESISDAVMVVDTQTRIVDLNPAALKLLGNVVAKDVLGKPAQEVLTRQSELIAKFRDVQEAQTEIAISIGHQTRHFQMTVSPLKNQRGTVTGRLYVLHEITELKLAADKINQQNEALTRTNHDLAKAQQQAEEASRLKSEFLATMSHELRTPLNAIIGFTDLMMTGLVGKMTDKQNDYLQRIIANGERLLTLINDVLDIAKIEAARLDLLEEPFAPADLLKNIDNQLHGLADKKGLTFETRLDPQLPVSLKGDPKRLEQILVNLIGNAIRFTEVGKVSVSFSKGELGQWSIAVIDTGMGIPPHALEYIFDEFRQVDGSPTRQHGGTGLGLAIVRKLAILMGGTVHVQSEVGKGSTFTVQLPLVVAELPVVVAAEEHS